MNSWIPRDSTGYEGIQKAESDVCNKVFNLKNLSRCDFKHVMSESRFQACPNLDFKHAMSESRFQACHVRI